MSEKLNVHHFIHIDYAQRGNYSPYFYYDSMKFSPYYDYMPINRQSSSYWPQMEDEFYNSFPYENNGYEWGRMWPYFDYNFPYGQFDEKGNFEKKQFDKHKLNDIKKEERKNEKNDKEKVSDDKAPKAESSEVPPKKDTFLGILKKNIKLGAKKED